MVKPLKGPDAWYQGCPNLIFYSKLYSRSKPDITMKELEERRKELDQQLSDKIEVIATLKEATERMKQSCDITATHKTFELFDSQNNRLERQLNDLKDEWERIDFCIKELTFLKEKKQVV